MKLSNSSIKEMNKILIGLEIITVILKIKNHDLPDPIDLEVK